MSPLNGSQFQMTDEPSGHFSLILRYKSPFVILSSFFARRILIVAPNFR